MARARADAKRPDRASGAPVAGPVAPEAALSNRALAALLAVQREEGWPGQGAGSKNRGGPLEFTAPGGGVVRRHALRGIASAQMATDLAIVIVPDGLPKDGGPVDVLVHLHGFEVWSEDRSKLYYGTGYEDARARGGAQPIDIGVMRLEQQMAAAGRAVVGILPQGTASSDFSKAATGKGFDLPSYVAKVFERLTADTGWGPGVEKAPTPGRAVLSGHSGGDQPISEMLDSGASGELAGLFLFDTMIVGEKENKARPKSGPAAKEWRPLFEGRIEKYVLKRLNDDLANLQKARLAAGNDAAKAQQLMRDYVVQRGFRLNVVWRKGGSYDQAGNLLKRAVDDWFGALDPTVPADVRTLLRQNYRLRDVPADKVSHMGIMADSENMRGAIEMLPFASVAPGGGAQPAPAPPSPAGSGVSRAVAALAPGAGNRAAATVLGRPARRAIQRDDEEEIDYEAEFASFAVAGAVEGGLTGYKDIRDLLIGTFGSIAAANRYYRGVRGVDFLGKKPQVHAATLGDRLAKAEERMKANETALKDTGWHTDLVAAASVGGFNVRRNRNNRSALSDHSFGWAIDVDAEENPNLYGQFPGRALAAVTGEQMFAGTMGTIAGGGTAQELLAPIEEVRAASRAFEAAFADEASLAQAMREYLVTRLKFDIAPDVPLLDMVKAAAGAGRAGTRARNALSDHLKEHWTSIPDAERFLEGADREQVVANKGWDEWKKEKARRDKERERAEAKERAERAAYAAKSEKLRKAGKSEDEIRKLALDPHMAARVKAFEAELFAITDKAAGTLIELWRIYVSSFEGGKTTGGRRVAAQSAGTPGTIAAHGFMSMPGKLAAALSGSDGGNLDWLGAAGARDFMHFQLKPAARPALT